MFRAVIGCFFMLSSAALAQEECRYYSGDGLSVSVTTNAFRTEGVLRIHATDGTETQCSLGPGQADTMRTYTCGDFTGDIFLVPLKPFGDFPDIIVMPPNILYWRCATPA